VGNLVFEASSRPGRVINRSVTEGVVEDERPAGITLVVLPDPDGELV